MNIQERQMARNDVSMAKDLQKEEILDFRQQEMRRREELRQRRVTFSSTHVPVKCGFWGSSSFFLGRRRAVLGVVDLFVVPLPLYLVIDTYTI